ncbi:MAG TPA: hypothetical protein VFM70_12120 [Salinimicrobium sp.]|nr:hypothetical protein [Salinimicrobium sp.]
MKKLHFLVLILLAANVSFAQVAVNTTEPSPASVLHLEAQQYASINYGGFLMPVVTEAQQAAIPVSTTDDRDDGLMVYVSDPGTGKQCWDIYDSYFDVWRSISCANICDDVLYTENFNSYAENTGIDGTDSFLGDYPVSKWTVSSYSPTLDGTLDQFGTLLNDQDYAKVVNGQLDFRDVDGPVLFQTKAIDISGYSSVGIAFDFEATGGMEYSNTDHNNGSNGDFTCGEESKGNDYLDIEVSTDGGSTYTEVPNYLGMGSTNHTITFEDDASLTINLTGYSGTTMIVRLRLQNWAGAEHYYLDNLTVFCDE